MRIFSASGFSAPLGAINHGQRQRRRATQNLLCQAMLPAVKRTKIEIAEMLGISRQQLILSERKPISPGIAVRIGKLFGTGPRLWLRMQSSYDAWHAEREIDTSKIPTIKAA